MKFKSLFSGKSKKNIINLLSAKYVQRVEWLKESKMLPNGDSSFL